MTEIEDALETRLYIGGKIAKHQSDVVSALAHHPLSLWLDTDFYAGLLHHAPVGEYRVLLGNGRWMAIVVDELHTMRILK